jgi:hypothetical protein
LEFYQWLVPLVALIYIVRIALQYRNRKRLLGSTILWSAFWLLIAILAILPDIISVNIARFLGFKSNINAVIFVAIGFLFVLMIYLTATVERLEKQVTGVVRELAIENQLLKESLREGEKKKDEGTPDS